MNTNKPSTTIENRYFSFTYDQLTAFPLMNTILLSLEQRENTQKFIIKQ